MKARKHDLKDEQGFTLIEVLVAVVMLAIGIIALTSMQGVGIKGNTAANILTTGSTWAADRIEQVFAMDYDDLVNGNVTSVDGNYTITLNVADGVPMPETKTVDITVSSMLGGQQKNITVRYIKARYVN